MRTRSRVFIRDVCGLWITKKMIRLRQETAHDSLAFRVRKRTLNANARPGRVHRNPATACDERILVGPREVIANSDRESVGRCFLGTAANPFDRGRHRGSKRSASRARIGRSQHGAFGPPSGGCLDPTMRARLRAGPHAFGRCPCAVCNRAEAAQQRRRVHAKAAVTGWNNSSTENRRGTTPVRVM